MQSSLLALFLTACGPKEAPPVAAAEAPPPAVEAPAPPPKKQRDRKKKRLVPGRPLTDWISRTVSTVLQHGVYGVWMRKH